jgi:hypothetical protein
MKNLKLIQRKIILPIFIFWGAISIGIVLTNHTEWILSVVIGLAFSYAGFANMISTQKAIVNLRKAMAFFPNFILRFVIYGVPIALAIKLPILNLPLIVLSLLSFQFTFILAIFVRGIKSVFLKGK